ncbi:hypothetical protein BVRB_1g001750 [Beta vulgaris subsp. vulgaris]|nr:hypothetical protein BVRB_1g001750 [Beta vulgaris subsp. vulgaris]
MSAPLNIPGTAFNGAVKGGAIIKEKLLQIIKNRRDVLQKNGDDLKKPQDLLSTLLVSCDENGKFCSEHGIANKIIGYLMASFYTTSTTITFVLNNLAEYPHVYDKVLEEQLEISKSKATGEALSWADIQKMKYSWNVVCESMRLTPPSQGAFKEVLTDFTYAVMLDTLSQKGGRSLGQCILHIRIQNISSILKNSTHQDLKGMDLHHLHLCLSGEALRCVLGKSMLVLKYLCLCIMW